jgi:Na+-transporting NADH:ubiquinone oxidoreductase subunit NqrE
MRPVVRALLALIVAVLAVGLAAKQYGFPLVAAGIGVRVGLPGAAFQLVRVLLPIVTALVLAVLAIRFAIRALRANATLGSDLRAGGKLLATVAWALFVWLVFELFFRQLWLGWATLFGSLGASLVWSAAAVALCAIVERLVPWSRAPRGLRHLGLALVVALGVATGLSAWAHRHVVSSVALIPVLVVGLALVASGVGRVESGSRFCVLAELGVASILLVGPIWSFL